MSVLTCMRGDCTNIMCDRFSYEYGYICEECFDELCRTRPDDIQEFMNSDTPKFIADNDGKYDQIFKINNGDGK